MSKWLIQYEQIFNYIQIQPSYLIHIETLNNKNDCINTFISNGNKLKTFINITTNSIQILEYKNIENNLCILLSCILKYNKVVFNKSYQETYINCKNLFEKKNSDYGDAFIDYKLIGILVRLNDKIRRLESLIKKNSINYESIDDTILDSFNYIILALILLKI